MRHVGRSFSGLKVAVRVMRSVTRTTTTIEKSMELTYNPNDCEDFLVNLCVVLLRQRQRPRGECKRVLSVVGEDVRHNFAVALRRGIVCEVQRQGRIEVC